MGKQIRRYVSVLLTVLILASPAIAWYKRYALYDAYRMHGYHAPANIAQLATDDTMTPSARRLFYVYRPALEERQSFNNHCRDSEKTIVLGCYVLQRGIYLYNITDPRLSGVQQVTAAHEMLHAEYDRLSSKERKQVDLWLNQAYGQVTDQRIKDTIEEYRKAGADINNELHSILGTEIRNLPGDLEQYYGRYFTDRKTVVSFSEKYESAFTDAQNQATAYAKQMDDIKAQLDALSADLTTQEAALSREYRALEADRANVTDVAAFNRRVSAYNAQVATYKAAGQQYNSLVEQYNDILAKYQALVSEQQELYKAIDSRPNAEFTN